jgi:hypothetical protein
MKRRLWGKFYHLYKSYTRAYVIRATNQDPHVRFLGGAGTHLPAHKSGLSRHAPRPHLDRQPVKVQTHNLLFFVISGK